MVPHIPYPTRNIYLLIRPLEAIEDVTIVHCSGPRHPVSFRRFQHWAIQIADDDVYEVVRNEKGSGYKWHCVKAKEWWKRYDMEAKERRRRDTVLAKLRPSKKIALPQKRLVGVTGDHDFSLKENGKYE